MLEPRGYMPLALYIMFHVWFLRRFFFFFFRDCQPYSMYNLFKETDHLRRVTDTPVLREKKYFIVTPAIRKARLCGRSISYDQ